MNGRFHYTSRQAGRDGKEWNLMSCEQEMLLFQLAGYFCINLLFFTRRDIYFK